MRSISAIVAGIGLAVGASHLAHADEAISIGSRLELFVDSHVVDRIAGDAELHVHRPQPQEVVKRVWAVFGLGRHEREHRSRLPQRLPVLLRENRGQALWPDSRLSRVGHDASPAARRTGPEALEELWHGAVSDDA